MEQIYLSTKIMKDDCQEGILLLLKIIGMVSSVLAGLGVVLSIIASIYYLLELIFK